MKARKDARTSADRIEAALQNAARSLEQLQKTLGTVYLETEDHQLLGASEVGRFAERLKRAYVLEKFTPSPLDGMDEPN